MPVRVARSVMFALRLEIGRDIELGAAIAPLQRSVEVRLADVEPGREAVPAGTDAKMAAEHPDDAGAEIIDVALVVTVADDEELLLAIQVPLRRKLPQGTEPEYGQRRRGIAAFHPTRGGHAVHRRVSFKGEIELDAVNAGRSGQFESRPLHEDV